MVFEISNLDETLKELNTLKKNIVNGITIYKNEYYSKVIYNNKLYKFITDICEFDSDLFITEIIKMDIEKVRFNKKYCWLQSKNDVFEKLNEKFNVISNAGNNVYSISFK